jgi:hypothetical protein
MALLARLALAWLVLVVGPIVWIADRGINVLETLVPATMVSDGDFAFTVPVEPPPLFATHADSNREPTVSRLRLFENGQELGPAHALGTTVKGTGHGAFSHWASHVYFSSSDGSNPRTNARSYTVGFPVYLTWAAQVAAFLGLPGLIAAIAAIIGGVRLLLRREWRPPVYRDSVRLGGRFMAAVFLTAIAVVGAVTWSGLGGVLSPSVVWSVVAICGFVVIVLFAPFLPLVLRRTATLAGSGGWRLVLVVREALDSPRRVIQTIALILTYSAALILISDSLVARESAGGAFKINFEYKVF